MVIGASGSGKTSLLRAGLQARLLEQPNVSVRYITPSTSPDGTISYRLLTDSSELGDSTDDSPTVIIFDQFEEMFAPTVSEDDLAATIESLDSLQDRGQTTVVIGMRADFFHRAATIPTLLRGLQTDPIVVGPMTTDEATDCIVLPAKHAGLVVAPALLVLLIDEFARHDATRGSAEALPLLSYVLYLLAEAPDEAELTRTRFHEIGGLGHALGRSADDAYNALTETEREACKALFSNLVELGTDSLPTRRTALLSQFSDGRLALEFDTVLAEFSSRRLLAVDVDTVTISHETLLTAWPLFGEWINDARDSLMIVRRIKAAASVWREADCDPQTLLRGTLLEAADALLSSKARNRLDDDDQLFVNESFSADTQRSIRDAEILARQLSMQATMLHDTDPSLGAQIALVAHTTASTVETRSALLNATSPLPGSRFLGGPGTTALAVSRNGQRVAFSNSVNGTIAILERTQPIAHENSEQPLSHSRVVNCTASDSDILDLALSPDGRLLAVGGSDGTVTLVDLDARISAVNEPFDHLDQDIGCVSILLKDEESTSGGAVMSVTFDSTGTQLFTGGAMDGVSHWEVGPGPTGRLVQLIPAPGTTMSIAVGNDQLMAISAMDGSVDLRLINDPTVPTWSTPASNDSPASAVALSADESMLVGGFRNGTIRVWRVHSPTDVEEVELSSAPFASWVNSVAIASDASLVAAASSDGNVRLWNTSTWHEIRPDLNHPTIVDSVEFAPGNKLLTTAEDGVARTWALSHIAANYSNHTIWSLTIDESGKRLATSSRNASVAYSILANGHLSDGVELPGPDDGLILSGASCISPDGSMLVAGTRQGVLTLRRIADRSGPGERLEALTGLIEFVKFSPDGTLIGAVDDAGKAQLWTLDQSGRATAAGTMSLDPPALGIAFSSDRSLVALSSESRKVHLYDIGDPSVPELMSVIDAGDSFAISAAFHPSMPILAAGNADRSVTLWDCGDPADPKLVQRLRGPGGHVMTLTFNSAGDRLAAGLTDGRAWIWNTCNLESATIHASVASGTGGVYAVAFDPDGRHLFAAGPHHQIDRWVLDENAARSALEAAVGDPITPEEWAALIPTLPYAPPV